MQRGKRYPPKAWRAERKQLEKEISALQSERARVCRDLAFAEVISYNKVNIERVEQNRSRQRNRQQSRMKHREEEI